MTTCPRCSEEVVLTSPTHPGPITDQDKIEGECSCSTYFFYEEGGWYREGPKEEIDAAVP